MIFIIKTFVVGLPEDDIDEQPVKVNKRAQAGENDESEHPLITDLDYRDKDKKRMHKAALWFEREAFQNLLDENDEDADLDKLVEEYKKKGAKIIGDEKAQISKKRKSVEVKDQSINGTDNGDILSDEETSETDSGTDSDSDYDVNKHHVAINNTKKDGFEIVKEGSGNTRFIIILSQNVIASILVINCNSTRFFYIKAAMQRY